MNLSISRLVLILSLVFITTALFSQKRNLKGSVSGKVVSNHEGEVVEYASVQVRRKSDSLTVTGGITNEHGEYFVENLKIGSYFLTVNFVGFKKVNSPIFKITPKNLKLKLQDVLIIQSANQVEDVVVVAQASQLSFKANKKVLNVSSDISESGGSAVEALETMPSVETSIDGEVSIRGSTNFQVLINGKPSALSGTEALEQIPADQIKSIELITTPSAKYDPQGDVGIVNVLTKTDNFNSFSINANVNYNFRSTPQASVNTSLLISDNTRLSLKLSTRNRLRDGGFNSIQEVGSENSVKVQETDGNRKFQRSGYSSDLELSHTINEYNSFDISYGYRFSNKDISREVNGADYMKNMGSKSYFTNDYSKLVDSYSHNFRFNYYKLFNKSGTHKLDLTASLSKSQNDLDTKTEALYDIEESRNFRTMGSDSYDRLKANTYIDYYKELKNGSLEMGYQAEFQNKNIDYRFENFNFTTERYEFDDKTSREYDFNRNIHAFYLDFAYDFFSKTPWKISIAAGLRTEYTDRTISILQPTDMTYTIDRWDLFPSLSLSKSLGKNNSLQASYSRRVNRPRDRWLDPFVEKVDENEYRTGNPELEPEYTDSYQFSLVRNTKLYTLSVEPYYRKRINLVERKQEVITESTGKTIINYKFENVDESSNYGVDLYGMYRPVRWINFSLGGNLTNSALSDASITESIDYFKYGLNGSISVFLPSGTKVMYRTRYRSAAKTLQGERGSMNFSMLSIAQSFLDRKLSISLSSWDIFNQFKHSNITNATNYYSKMNFESHWPNVNLTIKYSFNKPKENKSKKNKTAVDDSEGFEF